MKLLIKRDAGSIFVKNYYKYKSSVYCIPGVTQEYANKITAIQGTEVEVATEYLWDDQFNTVPIEGVSDCGLRILDFKGDTSIIELIIDDVRSSRNKCPKCGHYENESWIKGDPCWWCGR